MKGFEQILVPVDFSVNTEVAAAKAAELSIPGTTTIHLLHVTENINPLHLAQLEGLAGYLRKRDIRVQIHNVHSRRITSAVITTAKKVSADLIIIGKRTRHLVFPFLNTVSSAKIAEETACPVLTVKPGSANRKLQTVVMPVAEQFPKRKIEVLATLNCKRKLNVHLISILRNNQQPDSHSTSLLLQSMKSVRSGAQCNVQYSVIHSNNKATAILRYAEKVNADILLVSPEIESAISGWPLKRYGAGLLSV